MATATVSIHSVGSLHGPLPKRPCDGHMVPCDHSLSTMNHRGRKPLGWRSSGGVRARASPCPRASTLYDLLGVPRDVDFSDIKSAYRQMVKRCHPDVCSPANTRDSCQKFVAVQEAYETLSDPQRRALYDQRLLSNYDRSGVSRGHMAWEDQLLNLSSMQYRQRDTWGDRMRGLNQKSR